MPLALPQLLLSRRLRESTGSCRATSTKEELAAKAKTALFFIRMRASLLFRSVLHQEEPISSEHRELERFCVDILRKISASSAIIATSRMTDRARHLKDHLPNLLTTWMRPRARSDGISGRFLAGISPLANATRAMIVRSSTTIRRVVHWGKQMYCNPRLIRKPW